MFSDVNTFHPRIENYQLYFLHGVFRFLLATVLIITKLSFRLIRSQHMEIRYRIQFIQLLQNITTHLLIAFRHPTDSHPALTKKNFPAVLSCSYAVRGADMNISRFLPLCKRACIAYVSHTHKMSIIPDRRFRNWIIWHNLCPRTKTYLRIPATYLTNAEVK